MPEDYPIYRQIFVKDYPIYRQIFGHHLQPPETLPWLVGTSAFLLADGWVSAPTYASLSILIQDNAGNLVVIPSTFFIGFFPCFIFSTICNTLYKLFSYFGSPQIENICSVITKIFVSFVYSHYHSHLLCLISQDSAQKVVVEETLEKIYQIRWNK